MKSALSAVLLLLLSGPLARASESLDERARAIAHRYPLVDGHIDVPYRLEEQWEDVTRATAGGDFDLPRARAGGLSAPFMSIYTPADSEAGTATALANRLIDSVEALVARAPQDFVLARSAADVQRAFQAGRIALLLGMENGAPIAGDLAQLQHFHDRGVRYITLTHGKSNHIADSSYDPVKTWNGLSPFGVELVAAMNRLGVIVDIAHVSDAAFYEVLKVSKAPVMVSHSSLRHFTPGLERNVDDDMLRALASNGGVLQINFGSFFLTQRAREWSDTYRKAEENFAALHGGKPTAAASKHFEAQYRERFPYPYATVADVADHIDRAVEIGGIEHVGLGSDFDGVGDSLPVGLKDVSMYPNLIAELLRRNYTEADIARIMGGNVLRVLRDVERTAAQSR